MHLFEGIKFSSILVFIKSIALLYDNLGMQDKAIQAVEEARSENPTDVDLILTEANINFRLGNNQRYSELVSEALKQDPSNATLYYNLGVVSSELGERKDAADPIQSLEAFSDYGDVKDLIK